MGKEPELVHEVEKFQLEIVALFLGANSENFRDMVGWNGPPVSRLAWERFRIPPEELEEVTGDREVCTEYRNSYSASKVRSWSSQLQRSVLGLRPFFKVGLEIGLGLRSEVGWNG